MIQAIFFDFGNTLVFPDLDLVLAPLYARGVRPTEAQLFAAERAARQEMDLLIGKTRKVDQQYWETYYSHLLEQVGLRADISLRLGLVANSRTSANWRRVLPGTIELLRRLRERYRVGLISNSDGHIAETVAACGFTGCFEAIIDSTAVGYEKPNPQIFLAALAAVNVAADDSLYVGDIYSIDYLGAQEVGMHGLLMDRAGAYAHQPLPRIEALAELEPWLERSKLAFEA
jgi:putative hydrolase of the HAD superfamily